MKASDRFDHLRAAAVENNYREADFVHPSLGKLRVHHFRTRQSLHIFRSVLLLLINV